MPSMNSETTVLLVTESPGPGAGSVAHYHFINSYVNVCHSSLTNKLQVI